MMITTRTLAMTMATDVAEVEMNTVGLPPPTTAREENTGPALALTPLVITKDTIWSRPALTTRSSLPSADYQPIQGL